MITSEDRKYRLLVVDDNRAIHDDFRKILTPDMDISELDSIEADLFDKAIEVSEHQDFSIDSAYQGPEGLECVKKAIAADKPYSLAFIDMRMPPGWNGIETIEAIWQVDPNQQVVICSAYSDHSWAEIAKRLGNSDRLLILKKPFDNVEILQMAYAMSTKCILAREAQQPSSKKSYDNITPIRAAVNVDLLAPINELKDDVKSLQSSFEDFKNKLDSACVEIANSTSPPSQQLLADLRHKVASADLQNRIPDIFRRLELALQHVIKEKNGAKPKNSSIDTTKR